MKEQIIMADENTVEICSLLKSENDLSEHEFDHVFLGNSNEIPIINKEEVATWKYISVAELLMANE